MKNSRIRAKKVRRRKVAALAAYSRKYTVKNCTIPQPDDSNIIEVECSWNKERKLRAVKETAIWNANEWYIDLQKETKKKDDSYKYYGRKSAWYMLDGRKRYHYETRHFSWGDKTDLFRVSSECTEMYNRTVIQHKGIAWIMEQIVQHKLAKWEKKNPCPVKENQNPPDIFEQEYVVLWKAKREAALEHFRDVVVSIYDKLPLVGRFKKTDDVHTEEIVAKLKDCNNEGHKINELDPKKSKLLKKAQKKTNKIWAKRPNLVCTNLKDHKRQKGRMILPKAA